MDRQKSNPCELAELATQAAHLAGAAGAAKPPLRKV